MTSPVAAPGRRALVVDDSAAMRRQVRAALERVAVQVEEAVDGADAWRKLQDSRYGLIITDINMPLLDGLKLIALVRGGGIHQRTPVVVVSSEGAEADIRRARDLGANEYLVKPVQGRQVAEAVRRLLGEGAASS
jgi:two-component system chemotaxis response regulator CheY